MFITATRFRGDGLSVLPGITGLWQVMGRNDLTYPQRRRLDLFFVHASKPSRLYWLVLLRTPWCLLRGRGVLVIAGERPLALYPVPGQETAHPFKRRR